jgi:hypothetical protein
VKALDDWAIEPGSEARIRDIERNVRDGSYELGPDVNARNVEAILGVGDACEEEDGRD